MNRWQEIYNSGLQRDEKHKKANEFVSEIKQDNNSAEYKNVDAIAKKVGISRDEIFVVMPEVYKTASERDLTTYARKLISEEDTKKSQNERYDFMDKVIQNTPIEVLQKMVKAEGYFGQKVNKMLDVYGSAIGGLIKSTEDYRGKAGDIFKALNYMGSAGRFSDKESIKEPILNMVDRFIKSNPNVYNYQNLNYANLCEAGFSDEAEKIILTGMKVKAVGLHKAMELKEKGLLTEEQVKKLALEQNKLDIEEKNNSIKSQEEKLLKLNKDILLAEDSATKNPDNMINLSNFGLGSGKASEMIVKYRNYIDTEIERINSYIESDGSSLKRLKE